MSAHDERETRRSFMRRVARQGAVAAGVAVAPRDFSAHAGPEPGWARRITAATHRMCFDATAIAQGAPLVQVSHYLEGCAEIDVRESQICAVLVLRQTAVPFALADAFWERHAIGRQLAMVDTTTHAPMAYNPYARAETMNRVGVPALDILTKRGVVILACGVALQEMAAAVARRDRSNEAEVLADAKRSLVPGAAIVSSGVFALGYAQHLGCGYLKLS